MHITINEQPLQLNINDLNNLEEALVEVNDKYIPAGQQLFQVRVNGQPFTERYPRESRYINLDSVSELDIQTVTDLELTQAILQQSGSMADTLVQALEKGARLFRLEDEDAANTFYSRLLDSLRWLLQVGQLASEVLDVDLKTLYQPNGEQVGDYLTRMGQLLDEMAKVHEDRDFVMLADLLEYELMPVVKKWKKILAQLSIM